MTREIKFRAWDGKQMIHLENQWWCDEYASLAFECKEDSNICGLSHLNFNKDDAKIMQYTGLKDKNGKEIYEGDIVLNLPTKESVLTPKGWTGKVVYQSQKRNDNFYDCGFFLQCGKDIFLHISKRCEVIGNIYENPNLIKT